MPKPTRLFVISDLHLGGSAPAMMSFPQQLADFIASLPGRARADEAIELVLAGDVIDFLAIEIEGKTEAFTRDPMRAVAKLDAAIASDAAVFLALREHLAAGHGLTILLGNHDVELALPAVQAALCRHLQCRPGAIDFVADGRAWRFGPVLVEHGNRYDDANLNDWATLREIAASQSRGEPCPTDLVVSFGSQLVCELIHKYKQSFEFIDTLQPQGVLVAYLIAAFEPGLLDRLPALIQLWRGQALAARNAAGARPGPRAMRGGEPGRAPLFGLPLDTSRLDEMFGLGRTRRGPMSAVLRETLRPTDQALLHYINNGLPIPRWRLELVQETLREMSWADRSLELDGDCGPQGAAATRLRADTGARVVVMGHTHQARRIPRDTPCAEYINTGTWADLVTVPIEALATGDAGLAALDTWLRALAKDDSVRTLVPTWAEMRVEADGTLTSAELLREPPVPRHRLAQ